MRGGSKIPPFRGVFSRASAGHKRKSLVKNVVPKWVMMRQCQPFNLGALTELDSVFN